MVFTLLLGCAPDSEEADVCPDMPSSASTAPLVLENGDDCGYWSVAVDDELVLDMRITEAESPCEMETGDGLSLLYPPIYTAMSNDTPKWTFQVGAVAVAAGTTMQVTCDEGSAWSAKVDVVPAE